MIDVGVHQNALKKKAAEPGREALAAFRFVGSARRLVTCIAVTFGSDQALRRRVLFLFRDSKILSFSCRDSLC